MLVATAQIVKTNNQNIHAIDEKKEAFVGCDTM